MGIIYTGVICAKVSLLLLFPETDHLKTASMSLPVADGLLKVAYTGVLSSATLLKKTDTLLLLSHN